jgi:hypothetical protein
MRALYTQKKINIFGRYQRKRQKMKSDGFGGARSHRAQQNSGTDQRCRVVYLWLLVAEDADAGAILDANRSFSFFLKKIDLDSPLSVVSSSAFSLLPLLSLSSILLSSRLLFKLAGIDRQLARLELAADILVHGERDGLAGRDSHNPRRDALVKGLEAFLLEHVACDLGDARDGGLARLRGRLLQPRLDRVDGRVREGAHRAGDEADQAGLP